MWPALLRQCVGLDWVAVAVTTVVSATTVMGRARPMMSFMPFAMMFLGSPVVLVSVDNIPR
jgi:hypothetical protein